MSVQTQITRIANAVDAAKVSIANKGVTVPEEAKVDDLAALIESIIIGGELQAKTVTPTKEQQSIIPDEDYYGLSEVSVNPIPENYQDVSPVTAVAADVLAGKVIVDANGNAVTGTMTNRGAVDVSVAAGKSYTVPEGYHNGSGTVTSSAKVGYAVKTGKVTFTVPKSTVTISHNLGSSAEGFLFAKDASGTCTTLRYNCAGTSSPITITSNTSASTTFNITSSSITGGPYYYVIWG